LVPGRAPASATPQAYAWEALRSPLRTSGFTEAAAQLREAPPMVLGPRQASARLTVCPVLHASEVRFDTARQETIARLTDPLGEAAWLVHPYTSRGAAGSDCLLHALRTSPDKVRFVCGQARLDGATLILKPLSVVLEEGDHRFCIQPWVDENKLSRRGSQPPGAGPTLAAVTDPLQDYLDELLDCLAERWLTGPAQPRAVWSRLAAMGASLGLARLAALTQIDEPAGLLEMTVMADFAYREFSRLDTLSGSAREITTRERVLEQR